MRFQFVLVSSIVHRHLSIKFLYTYSEAETVFRQEYSNYNSVFISKLTKLNGFQVVLMINIVHVDKDIQCIKKSIQLSAIFIVKNA